MKSFFQFLSESASQQAARMGLVGNGHGDWYDKDGEFVAKTEKGRLKFYNKRQKVGGKDPAQTEKEKNISNPNFVDPALQQQQAPAQQAARARGRQRLPGVGQVDPEDQPGVRAHRARPDPVSRRSAAHDDARGPRARPRDRRATWQEKESRGTREAPCADCKSHESSPPECAPSRPR